MVNEQRINTIFSKIYNGVNSIYESLGAPWMYKSNIPIGVVTRILSDPKLKNITIYSQNNFLVRNTRIFIVFTSIEDEYRIFKTIIGDEDVMIIVLPSEIHNKDNHYNLCVIKAIYKNIFKIFNTYDLSDSISSIFSMITLKYWFKNMGYEEFVTKTMTVEKLQEICKYDIYTLYDNLKILEFI